MSKSIPEWQDTISTWAEETFEHDVAGIAKHTIREVVELACACGLEPHIIHAQVDIALNDAEDAEEQGRPKGAEEETADVVILALAFAGYLGFSLEDALIQKHSINLLREWGKPDADGVTEHVRNA